MRRFILARAVWRGVGRIMGVICMCIAVVCGFITRSLWYILRVVVGGRGKINEWVYVVGVMVV